MNKQKYIEHGKSAEFDMRGEYSIKCKCDKEHTLFTQADRNPEYYTDVFVKCDCGELINFSLPVN